MGDPDQHLQIQNRIIRAIKPLSTAPYGQSIIPSEPINTDYKKWFDLPRLDNVQAHLWLKAQTQRLCKGSLEANQLYSQILNSLEDKESLGSVLVDLVGFENFAFVSNVLECREKLLQKSTIVNESSSLPKISKTDTPLSLPNVYGAPTGGNMLDPFGQKYALPIGTQRFSQATYEEIVLPAQLRFPPLDNERLLPISELHDLCKFSFSNYKTLNRIQSIVYQTAFNTLQNMLICAPTGTGKTDIAILTILNAIKQNCELSNDTQWKDLKTHRTLLDNIKIVYIAPMKALAAEITQKLSDRLAWLGVKVKEFTGDMQLTKKEVRDTQILVSTPEKWDVITRKTSSDTDLVLKLRLLIIDEIHILHDLRGSVIESIVARTLRQVESSQTNIRLIGLSATLPNYLDVANFLRVNAQKGLFYFSAGFRPCPIEQHFIGIKGKPNTRTSRLNLESTCFEKASELLAKSKQILIFVHSRNDSIKTAKGLKEYLSTESNIEFPPMSDKPPRFQMRDLSDLYYYGIGFHHAGMVRSDRKLVEKLFLDGEMKVVVCTATLAWGVNLPAYAVVIKGTNVYNATKGSFEDLSILDVVQIFGRAGRPQFENFSEAYICTAHEKLAHYVSAITQQTPIESHLFPTLADNLNAEISLGTISNVHDALKWLEYTFLYVRMCRNPFYYGIDGSIIAQDANLVNCRIEMIEKAATLLQANGMVFFDHVNGTLSIKDQGRIASNYYLSHKTIGKVNNLMKPRMTLFEIIDVISNLEEFSTLKKARDDLELQELQSSAKTPLLRNVLKKADSSVDDSDSSTLNKAIMLIEAFISSQSFSNFALQSDCIYVEQNLGRIARGFFEIALSRSWTSAYQALLLCISIERRCWPDDQPLSQFGLPVELNTRDPKVKAKNISLDDLLAMSNGELGELFRNQKAASSLKSMLKKIPILQFDVQVSPLTKTMLRLKLEIKPDFHWDSAHHGDIQTYWLFVNDVFETHIYHSEIFVLSKLNYKQHKIQYLEFVVSIEEVDPPTQLLIRLVSNNWQCCERSSIINLNEILMPIEPKIVTPLLDLRPLPVTALQNKAFEKLFLDKFTFFNALQTQLFFSMYHTSHNVFIGAPTGSGKTVAAELALFQSFRDNPEKKCVYIAPMKALIKERVRDWQTRIAEPLGKRLVELTGDSNADLHTINNADIIVTTPEKWDGISRKWRDTNYVTKVSLIILDEIHLLGTDRGSAIEMIVSRMNYIQRDRGADVRILGLSTAVANVRSIASWLHVKRNCLFNFRHSVRPVPVKIYIEGFSGRAYCPRMATMNRPAFHAIKLHSPSKPVLIFVSSRRQTSVTAKALITLLGNEDNPRRFLNLSEEELEGFIMSIQDPSLKASIQFGIGIHHAGLSENDRSLMERLFVEQKYQVLIATSTLSWGINTPAHLVIVKGTEFYNKKIEEYQDMDLTDILQMIGRAGRPQFDDEGIACLFVQDKKKTFYKHFLHEGFPIESSLKETFADHLNAEIACEGVQTPSDGMKLLQSTFLYQRLKENPSFYELCSTDTIPLEKFLSQLFEDNLMNLKQARCVETKINPDKVYTIHSTPFGKIAAYYYLSHRTVKKILSIFEACDPICQEIIELLAQSEEFNEIPVRHNEELINQELASKLPWGLGYFQKADMPLYDPHLKAFLLIQAYFTAARFPISDYETDMATVLSQCIRILQAMIDIAVQLNKLSLIMRLVYVVLCFKKARWPADRETRKGPNKSLKMTCTIKANSKLEVAIVTPVNVIEGIRNSSKYFNSQPPSLVAILSSQDESKVHTLRRIPFDDKITTNTFSIKLPSNDSQRYILHVMTEDIANMSASREILL